MTQSTVMSLDQLCTKYGLNKNVLAFEMRRLKGKGVPEEQFLRYLQLTSEGQTVFKLSEFSAKLAPKESVFYSDSFYLTLRDLCRDFGIQPSQVKQYRKQGVSMTSAIDKARQKRGVVRASESVEAPKTSKEELDFLNFSPPSRAIIEKHNLDAKALIYEAKRRGVDLDTFIKLVDEKILESEAESTATTPTSVNPNLTTSRSVERYFQHTGGKPQVPSKTLGGENTPYNTNTLHNDTVALRLPLKDFIKALQQYNMLTLYLRLELQPTFSFRGAVYPNFEAFVHTNGLPIIDVRLLIFQFKGDIEKALAVAFANKAKSRGSNAKAVVYKGKHYESMRSLSNTFNIPYDSVVKGLKICFLPNSPRTVDEVVDELIFNTQNNYITVEGRRIILKTETKSYKNLAQLCKVENISQHNLAKALKQGYSLEQAIQYAQSKVK